MPWLSRSSSFDSIRPIGHAENIFISKKTIHRDKVSFIPAQVDGLAGTSPSQFRLAPLNLLLKDVSVLVRSLDALPMMVMACKPSWSWLGETRNLWEMMLQVTLAVLEIGMMVIMIPAFLLLPGVGFVALLAVFWGIMTVLSWGCNGKRVVRSDVRMLMSEEFMDEKWLFVNGMMTSNRALKQQCNRLSTSFGRQVTGVHLRTHGFVLDLLSSILQRSLTYTTPTSATLYSEARDALLTTSIHKVILISHNTGSAVTSQVLDRLHADLPVDLLQKLEIYTFGSAASHLSNPCKLLDSPFNNNNNTAFTRSDGSIVSPVKATLASRGHRTEDLEKVIPHIEHYASSNDIFARWGILHNVKSVLDNRFSGRVFVLQDIKSNGGGGFLFESHYIDALFPVSSNGLNTAQLLDDVVTVDISTAEKREFTAQGVAMPVKAMRAGSGSISSSSSGSGSPGHSPKLAKDEKRASWGSGGFGVDAVGQARGSARECEGLSVRQLSRLWRYTGGRRPVGEGVGFVNGSGNQPGNLEGR